MEKVINIPRILAPRVLNPTIEALLERKVEWVEWGQPDGAIDGIYCYGHATVDGALMDACGQVKVISNHGVGVDHVDLTAAAQRNIPVGNTPRVLDGAVADMAFALILSGARRVAEGDRFARRSDTVRFATNDRHGQEVHGATLGILGMGNIGTQIAQRALGFDMKILYHNRRRRPEVESRYGAVYVDRESLFEASDFLVVMVPLTQETRGMIGASLFALMKPSAVFVNIARGAVVDTDALTETMLHRRIFAAALDVTEPEPLPRDHLLLQLDNVTITPHLGSATIQTRRAMAELSVANLLAGLEGRPLPCQVL